MSKMKDLIEEMKDLTAFWISCSHLIPFAFPKVTIKPLLDGAWRTNGYLPLSEFCQEPENRIYI